MAACCHQENCFHAVTSLGDERVRAKTIHVFGSNPTQLRDRKETVRNVEEFVDEVMVKGDRCQLVRHELKMPETIDSCLESIARYEGRVALEAKKSDDAIVVFLDMAQGVECKQENKESSC